MMFHLHQTLISKKAEFLFSEPLAFHRACALPQRCAFILFAVSVGGRGNAAQHHGSEQALPAEDPRISDHRPDAWGIEMDRELCGNAPISGVQGFKAKV